MIEFFVAGEPRPQGSKRAFMGKGATRPVMVEQGGEGLKGWRLRLAATVASFAPSTGPLSDPVGVTIVFRMPVPKSRKNEWPIARNRGDIDKLCRAVLDELTGVLIVDDAQVVMLGASKVYAPDEPPGARICVWTRAEELALLAEPVPIVSV